MSAFFTRIALIQEAQNSLLCVGLDPDRERFPAAIRKSPHAIFDFNRAIIDATRDLVCCYKPQIAHYAACGAEKELEKTIDYVRSHRIPVLLDAKRGDIGSTAEMYARELFERYCADGVTVNPYLGQDSLEPYLSYTDRGVFILCRTSNPGGADLQAQKLDNGRFLYEHVAMTASATWNTNGNVGLVVGATRPNELRRVRELTGTMPILVPGIGAQGGDVSATVAAGRGGGMIVNSARAILYASEGDDFVERARAAALAARDEINRYRSAA